jgi:hypothetical protein
MDAHEYLPGWDERRTADVLREAIEATGGPQSEALGAVRVCIDQQHPDFPWAADWSGQIAGAKAGLRNRLRLPAATDDPSQRSDAAPQSREGLWTMAHIQAAREFLACIDGRSLERACRALALCDEIGGPTEMHRGLELWSELIEAGGDAEAVGRVLDILTRHQLATPAAVIPRAPIRHAA